MGLKTAWAGILLAATLAVVATMLVVLLSGAEWGEPKVVEVEKIVEVEVEVAGDQYWYLLECYNLQAEYLDDLLGPGWYVPGIENDPPDPSGAQRLLAEMTDLMCFWFAQVPEVAR